MVNVKNNKPVKPQVHNSGLEMLARCGEQYRRVYIEGHKAPPAVQQVIGSATHKVSAKNLLHKITHKGKLLKTAAVMDFARDFFVREWATNPIILDDTEKQIGLKKVKGLALDQTVKLAELHSKHLAPRLNPVKDGVEWAWVIEVPGHPYDLAGQVDVVEEHAIRDLKTANRRPNYATADTLEQLTVYGLANRVITGKLAKRYYLDYLVKESKTKPARLITLESRRTLQDFEVFKNRFQRASQVIQSGVFMPASRSDWWCSEKFCGFAADGSCPFFNGRTPLLKNKTTQEVTANDAIKPTNAIAKETGKQPRISRRKTGTRIQRAKR